MALTGYGQAADRLRGRDAGFDEHLLKPVDPALLVALISRVPPAEPAAHDAEDPSAAASPKATLYAFRRP